MDKAHVVISKKWHAPEITIKLSKEYLKIEMSADDFIKALARETGNPTLLLTNKQLEKALGIASSLVIATMKQATAAIPEEQLSGNN